MTNREIKRAEARRRARTGSPKYQEVPWKEWPAELMALQPDGWIVTRAFQNNLFVALVYDDVKDPEERPATRVIVRPNNGKPLGPSLFRVLQDCKNQLFGIEARGAMYLPKASELQDVANVYWFYVQDVGAVR